MSDRRTRAAIALLWAAFSGCAQKSPKDALDRYRDALKNRDVDTIWALSDSSFQRTYDREALRAYVGADPESVDRAVERLDRPAGDPKASAEVVLEDGSRVWMVDEGGSWRIVAGGLEPARFDKPELALSTFFAAVKARRLNVVRRAMPKRYADALATDDALSAHLQTMAKRIERAQAGIGVLTPGRAVIHGTSAELAYTGGKKVTLELEDGAWRILDLE